jgi:hypothetical protein
MANVLTVPNSGIISFNNTAYSDLTVPDLSASARIGYDGGGGINITSYTTDVTALDRFTVDGTQGRLFSVSDVLTGTLFSVNDITGLPILEVTDDDTVIAGKYNSNALVVSGDQVSIGNIPFSTAKLGVSGDITVTGTIEGVWSGQYSLSTVQHTPVNLTLELQSKLLLVNSSTSTTVVIPVDSTLNLPTGFQTNISRLGTGAVSVSGSSGVTLRSADGRVNLRAQYSTATVTKLSANDWLLFGDIN